MTTEHDMELIDRCEAYLEGVLSPEATSAFERDLARPEVAEVFREALLLRELIRASTADQVPEGLEERIAESLGLDPETVKEKLRTARFVRTRTALRDMSWMVRGPAMAMAGVQVGAKPGDTARQVRDGLSTVRFAAAPVEMVRPRGESEPKKKGPPLWQRALKLAWRRRK